MSTWPQWVIASIHVYGFVNSLYKEGKAESVSGAVITIVVYAATIAVLYYGGFWSVWGFTP